MKAQLDNDIDRLELERGPTRCQFFEAQVGFEFKLSCLSLELSAHRRDLDTTHEELTSLQEQIQELLEQLVASMERVCHSNNGLSVVR